MLPDDEPGRTNVLVVGDDEERAGQLARWIEECGEHAVVLLGPARHLIADGDDESMVLVVTDVDPVEPGSRSILERIAADHVVPGVPRLHLIRDPGRIPATLLADTTSSSHVVAWPRDPASFRTLVRLGAEVGRLRRTLLRSTVRDAMTGMFARPWVRHRLDEEFSRARRHRAPVSFAVLDIDRLRDVNEAHGEAVGDAVIQGLAGILSAHVRREDVFGRWGEESFALILAGNRCRGAAILANKIRAECEFMDAPDVPPSLRIRISTGISTYPDAVEVRSADDLVRRAEAALARAKELGGNRVHIDESVLNAERNAVLVIDADPIARELMEDVLAAEDLRVVTAGSVGEAIAAIRRHRPDLIVADLDDPSNPDASSPVLEALKRVTPGARIPLIALARAPGVDPEKWDRLGIDRFVTKPFSISVLRALARELLEPASVR